MERGRKICSLKAANGKAEVHAGGVACLAIDGGSLLSGGGDGALHLFELEATQRASAALRGHAAPVGDCALLRAGHGRVRALSSSSDGAIKLWDAAGGSVGELLPVRLGAQPCAVPLCVPLGGAERAAPAGVVYAGRGPRLFAFDLGAETMVASVPLPSHLEAPTAVDYRLGGAAHSRCVSLTRRTSLGCTGVTDTT